MRYQPIRILMGKKERWGPKKKKKKNKNYQVRTGIEGLKTNCTGEERGRKLFWLSSPADNYTAAVCVLEVSE